MEITTTARHFELTPAVREHGEAKLQKLTRYFDRISKANVVLIREKHRQIAEITLHLNGSDLVSREESNDLFLSIDRAADNLERQIKRYKERLVERGRKDAETQRSVPVTVESDSFEDDERLDEEGPETPPAVGPDTGRP
jgi:putative sigma-54 modulation protein